jgi:hypothetical protein
MGIHRFFTQSIQIRRLSSVGGKKKAFQSTATVDGCIQELDRTARQRMGIIEERTWIAWFDVDENIKEGDILVDEKNTSYKVIEITKKDYGVNEHLQVLMQEANE